MRVVVTGSAGFIGSHVVDHLLAGGHDVTGIDNLSAGVDYSQPEDEIFSRFTFCRRDLRGDLGSILEGADVVIHAAAYASIRGNWESRAERIKVFENGEIATRNLLEQMAPATRLVYLSSASVYGSADDSDEPWPAYKENTERVESPYAASKLACEAYVSVWAHYYDRPTAIARLVNVVGARLHRGVIVDFLRMARADGEIRALDTGEQRKAFVHVRDVAEVLVRMALSKTVGVHNISSGHRLSWWDVVEAMGWSKEKVIKGPAPRGWKGDPFNVSPSPSPSFPCVRHPRTGIIEALQFHGWEPVEASR